MRLFIIYYLFNAKTKIDTGTDKDHFTLPFTDNHDSKKS